MEKTETKADILFEILQTRRSTRDFVQQPIPPNTLLQIASAGALAPSAGNAQPCRFLVIDEAEKIHSLIISTAEVLFEGNPDESAKRRFLLSSSKYEKAAAIIVVLEDNESPYPDYAKHGCPLAAANIILYAFAQGYGSNYLTDSICPEGIKKALALSDRYMPYCAIAIGKPALIPASPVKKPLSELVWHNNVGTAFPE
jgi:nitroreductase